MADAKSDYAEKATLDWLLGGDDPTRPTGRYVALFQADPTDEGTGTEVSGGSYARQEATFGAASTDAGVTTATTTADLDWINLPTVEITHVGIFDASTGGNLIYHGALTTSKTLTSGDNFTINSGQLTITEN